ncbi:MAG TPA: tyrosine-type recombinase/integrase [Pirellulales bacterium]|nr:tyrosine-type recombinase/integrase [Pirellulales bacterium]
MEKDADVPSQEILPALAADASLISPVAGGLPEMVRSAGPAAAFAFDEFFAGRIRNPQTRASYLHAVRRFLSWAEGRVAAITDITPGLIGAYFDQHPGAIPTRKQHLAALRAFFDALVIRHVVVLNPAASVRGERYNVVEGKTPEISPDQVRQLLASIRTDTPVGRRDRALIATLVYTSVRAGAAAALRIKDFQWDGTQFTFRFHEKGGKSRLIPVRHDLQAYLLDYLDCIDWQSQPQDSPLFRSAAGRTGQLTGRPIRNVDVCRLVKRRLRAAGLPTHLSPHSFRVATITDLLTHGVPLEDVQYLAGHADPRTTRLYDRRQKKVTRNIVEKISI